MGPSIITPQDEENSILKGEAAGALLHSCIKGRLSQNDGAPRLVGQLLEEGNDKVWEGVYQDNLYFVFLDVLAQVLTV